MLRFYHSIYNLGTTFRQRLENFFLTMNRLNFSSFVSMHSRGVVQKCAVVLVASHCEHGMHAVLLDHAVVTGTASARKKAYF